MHTMRRGDKAIGRLSRSVSALGTTACRGPSPTNSHVRVDSRTFTAYRRRQFLYSMANSLASASPICSSSSNGGRGASAYSKNIGVALKTNQHASVATATATCTAGVGRGNGVVARTAWTSASSFQMTSSKVLQQQQQRRRGMATTPMSEADFHEVADMVLEMIHDVVEAALEDGFEGDFDCNLSQGVLNIIITGRGTWVLNKQLPNRQVWWSSPISGPLRFEFDRENLQWLNTRDGLTEIISLLTVELKEKCGVDLSKL